MHGVINDGFFHNNTSNNIQSIANKQTKEEIFTCIYMVVLKCNTHLAASLSELHSHLTSSPSAKAEVSAVKGTWQK